MDGSKNRQRVLAKKAVKICREVFAFCTSSEISSSCERNTYDPRIFSSIRPRTGRDKSATPAADVAAWRCVKFTRRLPLLPSEFAFFLNHEPGSSRTQCKFSKFTF